MIDVAIKYLHVLGAIILFGTGLGTAFQLWRANGERNVNIVAAVARNTVRADWIFTAPAVALQPVTGTILAMRGGWDLTEGWIVLSFGLFILAGLCWLPVVWLQIQMARIAAAAAHGNTPLPPRYHRYARLWFALGWPAFGAVLAILFLMIHKPEI